MTVLIKQLALDVPNSSSMEPVFLSSQVLLSIWNNSYLCSQVQEWRGDPIKSWFKDANPENGIITIGRASFTDDSIGFAGGRHRTRWMLQQGFKKIPVLLFNKNIEEATKYGLCLGPAKQGEIFT